MGKKFDLSELLNSNSPVSLGRQISLVWHLSIPGMLAQISSILMQYIDAAMVGFLGAEQSASIGLVASSTWVMGSLLHALCIGFTVQTAHLVGAGEKFKTKNLLFNAFLCCGIFSLLLLLLGVALSFKLPLWLGAGEALFDDAFWYFLIFCLSSPFFEVVYLLSGMLQCSGNMKIPGFLNALMCFLDIVFNFVFIFLWGLGVKGAALGSSCAAFVTALLFLYFTLFKSECFAVFGRSGKSKVQVKAEDGFEVSGNLEQRGESWEFSSLEGAEGFKRGGFYLDLTAIKKALKLALPVAVESSAFSGALVVVTKIVSPLGAVSLAANSFATTAESLCYMPGYGIAEAATTLAGQSFGAKKKGLVRSFSWITVVYGMVLMTGMGLAMYFACPLVFNFITPDPAIRRLSVQVLRIELFAEPLFGASIVAMGALRGLGDTFVPSLLNLFSLWVVRLSLSVLLVKSYGLKGIWFAMAVELCFRGIVLLLRLTQTLQFRSGRGCRRFRCIPRRRDL